MQQQAYQYKLQKAIARSKPDGGDYADQLVILDKNNQIVPFRPNRAQLEFRRTKTGRDLILKARQLGMSTEIQSDHFLSAITRTTTAATLAHDDPTTQKLRRMARRFYDGLSNPPPRGLDNATTTTYPQTGSEVTIATAGSLAVGRGGTYSHVHGSEVAFWKDAESLMAGLLQGVPLSGQIALESTPNGAQGWFYERCMEALDGASNWKLHFFAWWYDAGYVLPLSEGESLEPYTESEQSLITAHHLTPEQIQWRRFKQRELGRLFLQEYPEDPRSCFLASGIGYFSDITHLADVFTAPTNAQPVTGHRYVAALDFGQANDYTALSVADATTRQEVELWSDNHKPWGDLRAKVLATCQRWGVESLHPESNSMGSTNIEELVKEFRKAGCKTTIRPFETTAQSKPMMVVALHWALDEGGFKLLPDSKGRQEIDAYTAKQTANGHWTYEGLPHDDTVIARMGVWHAMSSATFRISTTMNNWKG